MRIKQIGTTIITLTYEYPSMSEDPVWVVEVQRWENDAPAETRRRTYGSERVALDEFEYACERVQRESQALQDSSR